MTHIKSAVIVLITAMILSLVLSYASIMTIIQTTKSNTERVLNSFVIRNSVFIFDSIKNGSDFTLAINSEQFIEEFSDECALDKSGNYFYNKDNDGNTIYRLTSPKTTFTIKNTLNLTSEMNIEIPIHFGGKKITVLCIPVVVKTSYNLKYY
jgi:hypothetical protein